MLTLRKPDPSLELCIAHPFRCTVPLPFLGRANKYCTNLAWFPVPGSQRQAGMEGADLSHQCPGVLHDLGSRCCSAAKGEKDLFSPSFIMVTAETLPSVQTFLWSLKTSLSPLLQRLGKANEHERANGSPTSE